MGLTTTKELRSTNAGAPTLGPNNSDVRNLLRDFLENCGWTVAWENAGAHKVVLRNSLAKGGSGCYVRILDNGSFGGGKRVALITIYENMTSIDSGTGKAGEGYFWKALTTGTSGASYVLTGDERTFYCSTYVDAGGWPTTPAYDGVNYKTFTGGGGDIDAMLAGDTGVFGAFAVEANPGTGAYDMISSGIGSKRTGAKTVPALSMTTFALSRNHSLTVSRTEACTWEGGREGTITGFGGDATYGMIDNNTSIIVAPAYAYTAGRIRGRLRGLFAPLSDCYTNKLCPPGTIVTPITKNALSLSTHAHTSTNSYSSSGYLFAERAKSWDDV